ncbi:hypothetical protein [Chitinophaga qingshengii]|uniref:Uncharacterized protein n=1 Tax=Chitinophaga qingshengii TaxID=1569794 RepID=A0ABR7TV83_9BACT|nr:hypothetical protein [Chitinophaga qingshengii]MBC9933326.1 hypothetical protein [Chitinophaga qingshengii]
MEELRTNDFLSLKSRMPLLIEDARKRFEYAKQTITQADDHIIKGEAYVKTVKNAGERQLLLSSADLDACIRFDNLLSRLIDGTVKVKQYRRKRLFENPYMYVAPPSNFTIKRILETNTFHYEKQTGNSKTSRV